MRSKDLKAENPKVLVIGEDSNLQWTETVTEYAMFADYYFREFPNDHGERSRNVEAQNLFHHIFLLTNRTVKAGEIYITNLCNDFIQDTPPKGKRVLIPRQQAEKGLEHIKWILEENPTIQYVIALSLQTNYWLQELGFYGGDETFLHDAQPRRIGIESIAPFYQPVNGKAMSLICGNIYDANAFSVKVIPALAQRDYPMNDKTYERFENAYDNIVSFFKKK